MWLDLKAKIGLEIILELAELCRLRLECDDPAVMSENLNRLFHGFICQLAYNGGYMKLGMNS